MWKIALFLSFVLFAVAMVCAYLKLIPYPYSQYIHNHDKVLHFLLFGSISWIAYKAYPKKHRVGMVLVPIMPVVVAALSVAEEFLQLLSSHRSFNLLDLAANLIGVLCFYLAEQLLLARKRRRASQTSS